MFAEYRGARDDDIYRSICLFHEQTFKFVRDQGVAIAGLELRSSFAGGSRSRDDVLPNSSKRFQSLSFVFCTGRSLGFFQLGTVDRKDRPLGTARANRIGVDELYARLSEVSKVGNSKRIPLTYEDDERSSVNDPA